MNNEQIMQAAERMETHINCPACRIDTAAWMFAVTNDGKAAASDAPCLRLHAVPSAPPAAAALTRNLIVVI
jgi:hypothetical protein